MSNDSHATNRLEVLTRLMRKTARQDWQAFSVLYAMTSPGLFGLILNMTNYSEASEDLLQEVYIKAWRQSDRFDANKSKVTTWLAAIARNHTIDWLRSQGSGVEKMMTSQSPEALDLAGGIDPADDTEMLDNQSGLSICIDQLSTPQRQAIFLAYLKGHSHSELVEQLGSPLGTVKSWVRRGLESLRNCLERLGDSA